MKICLAQTKSISGDLDYNINNHYKLINKAIELNADAIFFPELSLTNYEPKLAKEIVNKNINKQLSFFQELSNKNQITIGIGLPLKYKEGIKISMLVYQPNKTVIEYAKQLLHKDEFEFFCEGNEQVYITIKEKTIALAICFESLQSSHYTNASKTNFDIYLATVAKSKKGIIKANHYYKELSKKKTVLLVNSVGLADNFLCSGQSTVFDNGNSLSKMADNKQGILIFNTETNNTEINYIN